LTQGSSFLATLGERNQIFINPNGVVANPTRGGRNQNGRNRVAVGDLCVTATQGSSCVATLGFGTESRWDSGTAALRRSHDAVRAQLDLPDFFKNLAGNHLTIFQ
jgi:hypothetical protein